IKIKTAPRVNCNLSNNKVFYFSLHKINKPLSLKNNPLAFEYIHRKNKFNIFIQIPFFVPSLATPLRRCLECKALFQMKQMGINRLRSKIGSSAKWGLHQHILLIHLVSPKRFFHARG
ncbi:hypothetical protein KTC51_09800, partial [Klebsiella pneumoniae]|nr:hypothetical protein [Klebsiella pneumoniae]